MKFYQEYIYSVSIHKCQFHNQICMHKEYTSENRKIIIIFSVMWVSGPACVYLD